MPKVVFGFRRGERLDFRNVTEQHRPDSPYKIPDEIDGSPIELVISWHGFLVYNIGVDIAAAMAAFMRYVSVQGCCGRCIPGKNGTQALADKLDILREDPTYEVLNEAIELGESIKATSKCSFAPSSVGIVLAFLKEYPDQLHKNVKSKRLDYVFHMSAPCTAACPAHIKIPEFIDDIRSRSFLPSLSIIRENMPLPGLCGRVCPHPCEKVCRRREVDEAVNIMQLKQAAWNYEFYRHQLPLIEKNSEPTGKNFAIIGAGPAGLSAAYYLAKKGHRVDIFEAMQSAGGMAMVGIPDYRQPRDLLNYEIKVIRDLGVNIHYNRRLGQDISLSYLQSTYDATLIAIGAWKAQDSAIENSDGVHGVIPSGISYLTSIFYGERPIKGGKVVVIGGGNTAVDCARSARRAGSKVTVIYRRTENEMPAEDYEVKAAMEEGVEFMFLAAPTRALSENGVLTGLECVKMQLGSPDASGRRSPEVIKGSEFIFDCDYIIPAIGQKPDVDFLKNVAGLNLSRWNTIEVDKITFQTSIPKIFAAGDCVSGAATVVEAVGGAMRAAKMMDRLVMEGRTYLTAEETLEKTMYGNKIFEYGEPAEVAPVLHRNEAERISIEERISTFHEVEKPFPEILASREAKRCLRCMRLAMFGISTKGVKNGR